MSMGTVREVTVHRYGKPGARPKAYLQAGIHGNEHAGMVVLHHLAAILQEAASEGRIQGEVVLVPVVNPMGVSQFLNNELVGRFDFYGQGNFNRKFPDIAGAVSERVSKELVQDPHVNMTVIRRAIREELEAMEAANETEALRLMIARLAADADFAFDLHCDGESLLHLYTHEKNWPAASELAAQMGIPVVLLGADRVAASFDDAFNLLWVDLAARFQDKPVPHGCFAAAIELRGRADVSDSLAASDAEALGRFFMRRRVVRGDPGPVPESVCKKGAPLSGLVRGMAPVAGVAVFNKGLGDAVRAGEVVAEVIDASASDPRKARCPVRSPADGILFSIDLVKLVRPGSPFFKVAGMKPLERSGESYLED
jgi:hypothetical protein